MKKQSVTLKPTKDKKKWLVMKTTPEDLKKSLLLGNPYNLRHHMLPFFASLFKDADEIIITAKYKEAKTEDKKT